MSDSSPSEPIHWTGPVDFDAGDVIAQRWQAYFRSAELVVLFYPTAKNRYHWSARVFNGGIGSHVARSLPEAQKAARDKLITYADELAQAARRIQTPEGPS